MFMVLTYLVPVAAMAVCYWRMGRELWGVSDAMTQRQAARRRVVRMFLVVVSIFAVCWLPYHGYFIYAYHFSEIAASSYVQHLYLAFYWLAMANAMVNPLVYYCMNHRLVRTVNSSLFPGGQFWLRTLKNELINSKLILSSAVYLKKECPR
jgi:tachykinin receptor 3